MLFMLLLSLELCFYLFTWCSPSTNHPYLGHCSAVVAHLYVPYRWHCSIGCNETCWQYRERDMRKMRRCGLRAVHYARISCMILARDGLCLYLDDFEWWQGSTKFNLLWISSWIKFVNVWVQHDRHAHEKLSPGPPKVGLGPGENLFSGQPARADRLKISTRNLYWCAKTGECPALPLTCRATWGMVWNG